MTNSVSNELPSIITSSPHRVNWRVNDFCKAHGIGRTTFYEEVKRGELRVFKLGDRTLITDVEAKQWQSRKMAGSL